jgi:hypothetical protein
MLEVILQALERNESVVESTNCFSRGSGPVSSTHMVVTTICNSSPRELQVIAAMWGLGFEPGSSGRAASALNLRTIFPAPNIITSKELSACVHPCVSMFVCMYVLCDCTYVFFCRCVPESWVLSSEPIFFEARVCSSANKPGYGEGLSNLL